MNCSRCLVRNPDRARYCSACGAMLTTEGWPDAERRQLVVLFCDLAGSTELATRFDAEDFAAIVRRYHDCCGRVIQGLDGHVAQCLGDGVLAYFGYPTSHENDAVRAVRAGLQILQVVSVLNTDLRTDYGVELTLRVGIHAGVVVMADVGSGWRSERLALGSVPNVAARIQGVAAPNTVLLSHEVQRLVSGYVHTTEVVGARVAGLDVSTVLYEAHQEMAVQSRFDTTSSVQLTPFVGDRRDLDRLVAAWQDAEAGESRAIMLAGEAGIGKSRRVHVLKERLRSRPHRLVELQCTPETNQSAFFPVSIAVHALLASAAPPASEPLLALEAAVDAIGIDTRFAVPLLAPLLSISLEGKGYGASEASPFKTNQETLAALLALLLPSNAALPSLVIVEDLHWADASTLDLVRRMTSRRYATGVLIILTSRTESESSVAASDSLDIITVGRLSTLDAREMVGHVAAGTRLAPPVIDALLERSDGVPLFVEELTKTLTETGTLGRETKHGPSSEVGGADDIPTSVRGLLGARLDRLGDARAVLQLGAVLGREFELQLLEAVSRVVGLSARARLAELLSAGMLLASGTKLAFRHALIRDAAYAALLKATRRQYHERTAEVVLQEFPALAQAQPELVAQHYDRAGRPERALEHWLVAGQRALTANAYREAAAHARAGLAARALLNDSHELHRRELDLRSLLGMALIATEGYGSVAAEENYKCAERVIFALSRHVAPISLADEEKAFVNAWGVWAYQLVRSHREDALRAADQLHTLAVRTERDEFLLETHVARGLNYFYFAQGHSRALREFEEALESYDPSLHSAHALRFGQDPKSVALSVAIWIDAMTGHPDRAERRLAEGLAHARDCSHPFSEAYLLTNAAALRYMLRDATACREHAERAIAIGTRYGFPTWLAAGEMFRGWARLVQGEPGAGPEEIERHFDVFEKIRLSLYAPTRAEVLSQAQELAGNVAGAFASVERAIECAERTGERWYLPELQRRRGELGLRLGHCRDTIEHRLQGAHALALEQGNQLFALRAAVTLAQLPGAVGWRARMECALAAFPPQCRIHDVSRARAAFCGASI